MEPPRTDHVGVVAQRGQHIRDGLLLRVHAYAMTRNNGNVTPFNKRDPYRTFIAVSTVAPR